MERGSWRGRGLLGAYCSVPSFIVVRRAPRMPPSLYPSTPRLRKLTASSVHPAQPLLTFPCSRIWLTERQVGVTEAQRPGFGPHLAINWLHTSEQVTFPLWTVVSSS